LIQRSDRMAWHLESRNPDCKGVAVVDDETGEVMGCHDLEDDAQAQLAALKADEAKAESPPKKGTAKPT
jgi:hypothetical protein